jgi:hypothetical protein
LELSETLFSKEFDFKKGSVNLKNRGHDSTLGLPSMCAIQGGRQVWSLKSSKRIWITHIVFFNSFDAYGFQIITKA